MFPPRPLYAHGVDRQNPKTPGEGLRALRRGSGQVDSGEPIRLELLRASRSGQVEGGTIADCELPIANLSVYRGLGVKSAPDSSPLLPGRPRSLLLAREESDAAAFRFRRGHQLADGIKDHLELGVVFFLKLLELARELLVGGKDLP